MDRRNRDLVLVVVFLVILAFHFWILYRMVVARNVFLTTLLLVAIGLFLWRISIHANRYRLGSPASAPLTPDEERRRIRTWAPILVALLALHGWLMWQMVTGGEIVFAALLALAVVVFVVRLGWYGWRWKTLGRGPSGTA